MGRDEFAAAIRSGEVEHLLHRFEPKPGDCILIEAGTVHAIGAGVLLAEIQEMSDATFRIYDWGRVGADGKPRPASYSRGAGIDRFRPRPGRPDHARGTSQSPAAGRASGCRDRPYFALERLKLVQPRSWATATDSRS